MSKRLGSFGVRACRTMRAKLLAADGDWCVLPASWRRKWMVQRIVATPPWADMREIRAVYADAAELTRRTGRTWTVGHIVPLNHPSVCGLHVAWNLTPELACVNFSKGNRWMPDQLEMFDDIEQLRLF